ncbi:DUF3291 domain-containing protein [Deinococcus aquiradiocola]|uniref:DUF3291 domain-containing protein n=1 Tax=Deinococcus aquiradiocola TaxID=393059 RepID=A0A917PFR8_9DEIO|nr:DUF3291 domain-containing protein [Deinococcus aquiradiocola]GGJ75271.1 hypothetical protein GCM10008939_19440 [Deinococcus aquiradiocola]
MTLHLAQFNYGVLRVPETHPDARDFRDALAPINALAARSPGFVWQLPDEDCAAYFMPGSTPLMMVNLSVWEDVRSLRDFTLHGPHLDFLRRRREWFVRQDRPHFCMWWVQAGYRPGPDEARARLEHLRVHGPTPAAFTFTPSYPPEAVDLPASSQT